MTRASHSRTREAEEDLKFKVSLSYTVSLRTACDMQDPIYGWMDAWMKCKKF